VTAIIDDESDADRDLGGAPFRCEGVSQQADVLALPAAPRGVVLNGYVVGEPAGGALPEEFLQGLRAEMGRSTGNDPD
jgi:hypothetical protein